MTATVEAPWTADEWNNHYPAGTVVRYWPGAREGVGRVSRTRTPAWTLGHGAAVVSIDGYAGGIALTHVHPCEGPGLLTALHELAVAADKHAGQDTARETIDASLAAHAELDAACEAYRREHYPRAGRVIAVFGEVFTVSPAARRITCVHSERTDR